MENVYYKELLQLRKDYGDLLITTTEAQQDLQLLRNECDNLRASLASSNGEVLKLKEQLTEVTILKKQNRELSAEISRLEGVIEDENRELKRESAKFEEVKLKREQDFVVKLQVQKERGEIKYKKLENQYNAVMVAATTRYKELEDRVSSLENDVESLKHDSPSSGSKPMIATRVKTQTESSESGSDTIPAKEKLATSMPYIPKHPLAPSSMINLSSSDDDAELPSPTAHKRKLQTTGTSDKREDSGSSRKCIKSTDITGVILQPCVQKVGVASDSKFCGDHVPVEFSNTNKEWEYAADMLDSLQHDTELCMKGVCALSRHHMLSLREKALVKFLTDGDAKGRLKRTLAELEAFNPEGAHECKSLAMIHHEELYGIYKEGNDPYFAHDTIFSRETIM